MLCAEWVSSHSIPLSVHNSAPAHDPLLCLFKFYHPQGNSSLSRHIRTNFKLKELCSQMPMSIVTDKVWMEKLKGAIIPRFQKNHPVLLYTQSCDPFHYFPDNYSDSIPLSIKNMVPANDCSIRTWQSNTSGSFKTTMASQISLDHCTAIPRETFSQNSNIKLMRKE